MKKKKKTSTKANVCIYVHTQFLLKFILDRVDLGLHQV